MLTAEMMQILINEYFSDPTDKGYRKYGNMMLTDGEVLFYAPQILALVNAPQYTILSSCMHETGDCAEHVNEHDITKIERSCRVVEIFDGISGAPNQLRLEHLVQVYNYFKSVNPTLVNKLKEE